MDPMTAQAGLALLSQPSAGSKGGTGGGGYQVDQKVSSDAQSSLDASGSTFTLGGGDLTLGGISSKNMSLIIIATAIVAGIYLFRKAR